MAPEMGLGGQREGEASWSTQDDRKDRQLVKPGSMQLEQDIPEQPRKPLSNERLLDEHHSQPKDFDAPEGILASIEIEVLS